MEFKRWFRGFLINNYFDFYKIKKMHELGCFGFMDFFG